MERKRKNNRCTDLCGKGKRIRNRQCSSNPNVSRKGIGGKLLETAFQKLSQLASNQTRIIIRTGTTSSAALHLYQKMGYVEIGRVKDYFIHHYSEPIFENGDQLRDQVILAIHLPKNSFN